MMDRLVVLDVETPNRKNDSVCSVGLTVIENNQITESKNILINPECEFDDRNTSIHGITSKDVEGCMNFVQFWQEYQELFDNSILVFHNAKFDLTVIKKALEKYKISSPPIRYFDTSELGICLCSKAGLPDRKLTTLCEAYGIPLEHHNSQSDSYATAQLFICICQEGISLSEEDAALFDFAKTDTSIYKRPSEAGLPFTERKAKETPARKALKRLDEYLQYCDEWGTEHRNVASYLANWKTENIEFQKEYPFVEIMTCIDKILADGIVEDCELKEICNLCQKVLNPIETSEDTVPETIAGENIVVTGEFETVGSGNRGLIEDFLTSLGANVQKGVNGKTTMVLVGQLGSKAWAMGNYGGKVKKAMELKEKGKKINIVQEDKFFEKHPYTGETPSGADRSSIEEDDTITFNSPIKASYDGENLTISLGDNAKLMAYRQMAINTITDLATSLADEKGNLQLTTFLEALQECIDRSEI